MELAEYLKAVGKCPEEIVSYQDSRGESSSAYKITAEFGVYDGWTMVLKSDIQNIEKLLSDSHYTCDIRDNPNGIRRSQWRYNPGTIVLSLQEMGDDVMEEYKEFNLSLNLNPYQGGRYPKGKKMIGVSQLKAMTFVISDLGRLAIRGKIPICIINSVGWAHLGDKNFQEVRFNPK